MASVTPQSTELAMSEDRGSFLITDEMLGSVEDFPRLRAFLLDQARDRGLQLMVEDRGFASGVRVHWRPEATRG